MTSTLKKFTSHIEVQILEVEVENGKKKYKANTNAIN